jgi:hypothetical protein
MDHQDATRHHEAPAAAATTAAPAAAAPGRRTLTEGHRRTPNVDAIARAVVTQLQAEVGAAPADGDPQAIAAAGFAGPGRALPYLDAIQRSFGRHDVSAVRAHVGGATADAAASLGARAYASDGQVGFAREPDLFLVAHEAAHVVQQRGGVQLSGGVGAAGDVHEQHADAVAAAVVRGDSAEALLDQYAGGPGSPAVQRQDGETEVTRRSERTEIWKCSIFLGRDERLRHHLGEVEIEFVYGRDTRDEWHLWAFRPRYLPVEPFIMLQVGFEHEHQVVRRAGRGAVTEFSFRVNIQVPPVDFGHSDDSSDSESSGVSLGISGGEGVEGSAGLESGRDHSEGRSDSVGTSTGAQGGVLERRFEIGPSGCQDRGRQPDLHVPVVISFHGTPITEILQTRNDHRVVIGTEMFDG